MLNFSIKKKKTVLDKNYFFKKGSWHPKTNTFLSCTISPNAQHAVSLCGQQQQQTSSVHSWHLNWISSTSWKLELYPLISLVFRCQSSIYSQWHSRPGTSVDLNWIFWVLFLTPQHHLLINTPGSDCVFESPVDLLVSGLQTFLPVFYYCLEQLCFRHQLNLTQ